MHLTYNRGEFNNASAFKRPLYWCQALHITNNDRYQSTSARRALALLNSTQVIVKSYAQHTYLEEKTSILCKVITRLKFYAANTIFPCIR